MKHNDKPLPPKMTKSISATRSIARLGPRYTADGSIFACSFPAKWLRTRAVEAVMMSIALASESKSSREMYLYTSPHSKSSITKSKSRTRTSSAFVYYDATALEYVCHNASPKSQTCTFLTPNGPPCLTNKLNTPPFLNLSSSTNGSPAIFAISASFFQSV